ncbi:Carboxypeptidase M [Myotis brandtii]|uniref:Carboxypeptidase M n=1 Tax=Myotis brandtii TaxID=109478 RepID=S7NVI0_MYOBR|nr:Carboxypeptidase M [Myotis brandtii]
MSGTQCYLLLSSLPKADLNPEVWGMARSTQKPKQPVLREPGIKGQVFDQKGNPLPNVIVEVQDRKHICPYKTNKFGEYYLLLLPGSYTLNVTVPGQEPHLTKVIIPKKSQDFSALKKDIVFPLRGQLDSILVSNPSCPMIPLYSILPSHSAATKPSLFLFLVTLFHILFK